jgi:hypothetical protein
MREVIKLKNKAITDDEIKNCVKLLHKDYHDAKIIVFHKFKDYLKWSMTFKNFDYKYIKEVYKGRTVGCYNSDLKHILIYVFNDKSNERYKKINIIHTLMHELRHYYQYNFKESKWRKESNAVRYELGDYRYKSAPIEHDANRFAARMMIKHREKISNILNIYPSWEVRGYE